MTALLALAMAMFKVDPARTGYLDATLGPPARLLWQRDAGGEFYSSPAVFNGTAFLGNSDAHIYAYSLKDGSLRWKAPLGCRVYGASPHLEGGRLYTTCVDACAVVLDAAGGRELARHCLPRPGFFQASNDVLGAPLLLKDALYFGSDDGALYAFALPEFRLLWKFQTAYKIHDAAPAFDGRRLVFASGDGRVYALDPVTGAELWRSEDCDRLNTTPALWGGRVFFGSKDGRFRALDLASGAKLWEFDAGDIIISSPSVAPAEKTVVFGCKNGRVYALGAEDSGLRWTFQTGGAVLAPPLITGSTVWIGSYDGFLYALALKDGAELWRHPIKGGVFASPAAAGDRLLVGGRGGILYCFQVTPSRKPRPG